MRTAEAPFDAPVSHTVLVRLGQARCTDPHGTWSRCVGPHNSNEWSLAYLLRTVSGMHTPSRPTLDRRAALLAFSEAIGRWKISSDWLEVQKGRREKEGGEDGDEGTKSRRGRACLALPVPGLGER